MIGIIVATDEEAQAIMSEMSEINKEEIAGIDFHIGKFSGKDAVFVQAGIGKVNAAITATLLIYKYKVGQVIFSGVAGSLDESVQIGDIVVGTDTVQHDMEVTEFGYRKGQIPQMPVWSFECDSTLIEKVKEIEDDSLKIYYGRILTGDQFISSKDMKINLGKEFKALCVDMESAAVAQVCYRLNTGFLIIRSISDSLTDKSGMEYQEFVKLASNNSKELLKRILI